MIIIDWDLRSTFETQRFDPKLKGQQPSTLAGSHTPTPTVCPPSSFVSPKQQVLTIKEPLNDGDGLSRVLSSVSSNPSTSGWHEGHSTGVSTLATTLSPYGLYSRSTSATSFDFSTGERPRSVDEKKYEGAPKTELSLIQSLMSAEQADAHIPPSPAPLRSRFSEYSESNDEDDSVRGQTRLVPSSRMADANAVPAPTTRMRSASEPPPLSHPFYLVHPEYDSDYDGDTDIAESILTSSFNDAGYDACLNLRDVNVPNIPIPSPNLLPYSIPLAPASPPPSSSFPPSSCHSKSPIPIARTAVLSNIYEEESSHRRQASINSSSPGPLTNPLSLLEDTPMASPTLSGMDCIAWWRCFPMRRRTGSGSNRSEFSDRVIGETKARAKRARTEHVYDCQTVLKTPPDSRPRVHREKRHPLPPLRSVPGCIPRYAARQMCSRTKFGARTVFSIVLPCIPVAMGETKRADEKMEGRAQQDGGRTPGVTITANGGHSTKPGRGRNIMRKKSSTTLLVRVDRQVDRVVDYQSS